MTGVGVRRLAAMAAAALALCLAGAAAAQGPPPNSPQPPPPAARDYGASWEEFQDLKQRAGGGTRMTWDKLPDWTGVYAHDNGFTIDPLQQGRRATVELTPEFERRYDDKLAAVAKGVEWDPLSACLPAGYPRWLVEPFLREFILRPEQAWLVTEQNAEIRRIYADGRDHVPDDEAYPLWEGDSIGFWDGDTLVVHTKHLRAGTYQRLQPEHSDQVSTVERWRKIHPDVIEVIVSIYDPLALTKPWRVRHTYSKVDTPNLRINHWSCAENNNVVRTPEGGSDFVLPGEPGYIAPDAVGVRPTTEGQ